MIKVLIVDDSGFMRLALKKMLERSSSIQVVGEAITGEDAVVKAKATRPDIITMDVEMPDMNGLEATKVIMKECPTAIIMVSSLTSFAAEVTIQALQIGAVDYISKSSSFVSLDIVEIENELLKKVLFWAENFKKPKRKLKSIAKAPVFKQKVKSGIGARHISLDIKPDLVLIAASTGGPKLLPQLMTKIREPSCPVIIALHMPELYTKSFAGHLAKACGHKVVEGSDGMDIRNNMIVVLPGGVDSHVVKNGTRAYTIKKSADSPYSIHPSANALFLSALQCTKRLAGVVLSGMGDDGMEGAIEMNKYGLPVVAQNEESCVVYGMPRAVVEAGVASACLDIEGIASKMNGWFGNQNSISINRA